MGPTEGSNRKYRIVAEIKSAYGCAAGHKAGDRIIVSGDGVLQCKDSPEMLCFGILSPMSGHVGAMIDKVWDAILKGQDPEQLPLNKLHCIDVGVDHGGWGELVAEVKVVKV